MRKQIPTWLKPRRKKKFVLEIAGIIMILLLIVGGILWQVNPQLRKYVCPSCGGISPPVDSNIYMISHPGDISNFPSKTFLYTLDAQSGKVKNTDDLQKTGGMDYQKVMNGISYELFNNSIGSLLGTHSILLATRLRDGVTLWSDTLGLDDISAIATPTVLYVYGSDLTAINLKNGAIIWHYSLQSSAEIILDNNTLLLQESGNNIVALRADNGKELWHYGFNDQTGYVVTPVADNSHAFFGYVTAQQSKVLEFDEHTGSLLWQEKLNAGDTLAYLHIENQCLLIETTARKLSVLRAADKSTIWSYMFQSSYTLPQQQQEDRWIYTDDMVYALSAEVNTQTFATNRVMRAWQVNSGKKLFQVNLDLAGEFGVVRIQNQLIFTSMNDIVAGSTDKPYNDVEARQAQTGALLWHKHIGQLPPKNDGYPWHLSVVDSTGSHSDDYDNTCYYLPADSETSQSMLYISLYGEDTNTRILYALNMQDGSVLWQINPDALNSDPKLHFVAEFPLPTFGSFPQGIATGPDGNLWFTEYDGHKIGRITPSGKITEFPLPIFGSYTYPYGITAGPDGNLWFTESAGKSQIGRITPGGKITKFPVPTSDGSPEGIAVGPDNNLWFTESDGNQIGRIRSGK